MLRGDAVRFDRVSPVVRWTVVGAVLVFGLLVAGLRGPGQSSQAMAGDVPMPTAATSPPAPLTKTPTATPVSQATPRAVQTSAPASDRPADVKLQYGCKKGETYGYNVKIAGTMPDEETTHEGVLTYDVVSSTDEQFTLKCSANLHVTTKPKGDAVSGGFGPPRGPRGRFGPPRIPAPPGFFGRGGQPMRPQETTFDRLGKIIRHGESPWLPFILGKQVELVVEQFPTEAKSAWTMDRELGVIEHNEASEPPFFGPFGHAGSETTRGAKEHIDYAILSQNQDSVRISKKYSLKTAPEQGVTHIDMSGNGELVFDRRLGVLRSQTMKYEIHVNESNVAVTVPFTLDCRLLSDAEMAERKKQQEEQLAKAKAEMAARAAADKPSPLANGEGMTLLRDLHSGDEQKMQQAARRLSKAIPGKNPKAFSKPLCVAYRRGNDWTQAAVMAALRVWAGPDAEKLVIEASRHTSFMVRREAIPALGRFKTAAAAEAAAAQVASNRGEVEAAMKAMGPVAETAAISLLSDSSIWVRASAANILAQIGGKKALAALNRESQLHPNEIGEVKPAIAAIENRLGDTGDNAESAAEENSSRDDENKKPDKAGTPAMRTWRAVVGNFTVEASFVALKAGKVAMRRADGRVLNVPLDKLSKADQDYAKQQAKAQQEAENPFQ